MPSFDRVLIKLAEELLPPEEMPRFRRRLLVQTWVLMPLFTLLLLGLIFLPMLIDMFAG